MLSFLGGVLVFLGVACLVAEALHLVVGDAGGWLTLERVWAGVHVGSLDALHDALPNVLAGAAGWLLTLPSWLVLLVPGLPLLLLGGRGRERGGFG